MSLKKYHFIYLSLYIVVFIVLFAILYLSDTNASIFVSIISAFLPSIYVIKSFISDHKRAPTKSEQLKLTWWSIVSVWGTSITSTVIVFGYVLWQESASIGDIIGLISYINVSSIFIYILLAVLAFMTAIHYAGFMYIYGKVAQQEVRRLEAKNKL